MIQMPTDLENQITISSPIAYLCAEFAMSDDLPIFSGGLGILAGDMVRQASQDRFPLVAVGLLYKEGYFRQIISPQGSQEEEPAFLDLAHSPIRKLTTEKGEPFRLKIYIRERTIFVEVWEYREQDTSLYLLDTDVEDNSPLDRRLTLSLYPADNEWRIQQEIILGVGGVRTLAHLGIQPALYHLNEGHSAFALLEIAHQHMKTQKSEFAAAFAYAKQKVVFTNHTLIPSGNDVFEKAMVSELLEGYAMHLGLSIAEVLTMGSIPAENHLFSMTHLALTESSMTSAVSRSHAQFAKIAWPDSHLVPITNGVNRTFWQTPAFSEIYDQLSRSEEVLDEEIWEAHLENKKLMLKEVLKLTGIKLSPEKLTITWARRIATYKQPTLLFSNIEKLKSILTKTDQEVQIILAGKAHPSDLVAKAMISELTRIISEQHLTSHVLFVPNYSLSLAKLLVAGSDVWLNTPIKGQEACGTSGMKSAMNGALQCAISDGWTDEILLHQLGFMINPINSAESLYGQLEEVIVPMFYHDRLGGYPAKWVLKMKETILETSSKFSSQRMLAEYIQKLYLPALAKLKNH